MTLTGGQTAQFRRDFRLNSLLGSDAKTNTSIADIPKEEDDRIGYEIQLNLMDEMKKNRVDPRHHALDAMVLGLIPEWRHFQAKKSEGWRSRRLLHKPRKEIMDRPTPFFDDYIRGGGGKPRLDKNAIRQFLARMLGEVDAELVAFKRAHLEETLYGKSMQQVDEVVSKPLDEMVFTNHDNAEMRQLDAHKLRRWLKRCVDVNQKQALESFLATSPSVEDLEVFKKVHRKLFGGGKARVRAPKTMPQYTIRKELRLLAYESNTGKKDTIFKPEWVRDDTANIDINFTGMALLKSDILSYLDTHAEITSESFKAWLEQRCQSSIKSIRLRPIAEKGEEAESKRRGESRKPSLFGCRQVPLAFAPKRLAKAFKDICDPWLRDKLRTEFQISGEGKKATYRNFKREEWETFCRTLRKPTNNGSPGPRVLKVTMLAGNAEEEIEDDDRHEAPEADPLSASPACEDEFKESTKTQGAFFKGKSHQGYYLYLDETGRWRRNPVYAHQSRRQSREDFHTIKERLSAIPGTLFHEVGFLQTGCKIQLPNEAILRDRGGNETGRIAAGYYRLNTLNKTGQMKLTSQCGKPIKAQVDIFIAAGLRRAD